MIEISTENVKRIVVWLKPELLSRMDGWLETANCKNRSEFISKALRFYMGYLTTDDVSSYVCESVSQNIRGMLSENTNRISKLMIQQSGQYEFDENLDEFYDYEGYALQRMDEENGMFSDRGYIAYKGYLSLEEIKEGGQGDSMEVGWMNL